jgi:protein-tyrosine phosphatase
MRFVDLHSHVLPGLDDGVKGLSESMELTAVLQAMGFSTVCATPHQKVGWFVPTRELIDSAYAEVRAALSERTSPLELHLGAENFWDELFLSRVPARTQPTYTGGKAFLFELDTRISPPRLEDQLFHIRLGGLLPVMAHPERYAPFWEKTFARYQAFSRSTALVVDLGALDGAHGQKECTAARRLVEEGLAHACASDAHSVSDARSAGAGIAWIRKRLGEQAVTRLLADNPRRILNGELPD